MLIRYYTEEDIKRLQHWSVGPVLHASTLQGMEQISSEEKEVQSKKEQQEPQAPAKQE